jgi:hypothetical protein
MPKLTLRDLFAVVTIVALALGWWLDRSRLAQENRRLAAESRRLESAALWFKALVMVGARREPLKGAHP